MRHVFLIKCVKFVIFDEGMAKKKNTQNLGPRAPL